MGAGAQGAAFADKIRPNPPAGAGRGGAAGGGAASAVGRGSPSARPGAAAAFASEPAAQLFSGGRGGRYGCGRGRRGERCRRGRILRQAGGGRRGQERRGRRLLERGKGKVLRRDVLHPVRGAGAGRGRGGRGRGSRTSRGRGPRDSRGAGASGARTGDRGAIGRRRPFRRRAFLLRHTCGVRLPRAGGRARRARERWALPGPVGRCQGCRPRHGRERLPRVALTLGPRTFRMRGLWLVLRLSARPAPSRFPASPVHC